MMNLNKARPGFDEAMELLCTLPSQASPVSVSDLAEDFGYATQDGIRRLLDILKVRGHEIITARQKGHGFIAYVAPRAWSRAQAASLAYWESVYPESRTVAA